MSADRLITDYFDIWTSAVAYGNGNGRNSNGEPDLTGIDKLRELILDLAVSGKLVSQEPSDQPAEELVNALAEEQARLDKEGYIRRPKELPEVDVAEKPFAIPESWEWVRLGDVGQIVGGGTPKSGEPAYWCAEGVKWLTPADLYGYSDKYICNGRRDITEKGLEESSANLVPGGTVLFSSRAPIGYVAIAGRPLATNQGFKSCVPYLDGLTEYLYYYLKRSAKHIDAKASGTTFKEISGSKMALVPVALPPLREQPRIVERVDELMALCDRLEQQTSDQISAHETLVDALLDTLTRSQDATELADNWARVAAHFDTLITTEYSIDLLEQTILQLAVMGRLVPQVPDDEPAAVLLKRVEGEKERLMKEGKLKKPKNHSSIIEAQKPFDLPSNWEWARLGDIMASIQYGVTTSAKEGASGVRLLRITDIQNDQVDWDSVPGCEIEEDKIEKYKLSKGDILVARTGGTIGKSYLVDDLTVDSVFASYLIRLKSLKLVNSHYLKHFFASDLYWEQLRHNSMGTGQPNVNGTALANLIVPVPPISEQERIVEKVDELMALGERIKKHVNMVENIQNNLAECVIKDAVA